jgi:hypothetical protein
MNDRPGAPQLLPRDVDLEIGEAEVQSGPLIGGVLVAAEGRLVK